MPDRIQPGPGIPASFTRAVVSVVVCSVFGTFFMAACDRKDKEDEELQRRVAENEISVPQQKMVDMITSTIRLDPASPECILAWYRVGLNALFQKACLLPDDAGVRSSADEEAPPTPGTTNTSLQARLYNAAVFGDFETVRAMLDKHAELINAGDKWGFRALHGVAGEDQVAMAELLISRGANVNAVNDEGITPLHLAADVPMIEILVKHGADLDRAATDGSTPLIVYTSERDRLRCITALIALGADPSKKDDHGRTAADIARAREERSYVRALTTVR